MKQKIKENWQVFSDWWLNLAPRERKAFVVASVFLSLFIFYEFIFTPYVDYINSLRKRVVADQKLLFWLQTADQEIKRRESEKNNLKKMLTPVALMSEVKKEISQYKLDSMLTQLKQANHKEIEMHFQNVDFDKLIHLLIAMTEKAKVKITQMSAVATGTQGMANADVTMSCE